MTTTVEHIAIEALRNIAKLHEESEGVVLALKALGQIDAMNKPAVHNLSAADVIIDKPPGGGL